MLALETVNSNVVGVTNSIPLKEFAEVHRGAPAQVFEQRLEGDWEHWVDENCPRRQLDQPRATGQQLIPLVDVPRNLLFGETVGAAH